MTTSIVDIFGSNVFGESEMKKRLPKETFKELQKTIHDGQPLNIKIADAVAFAMKEWAIEKKATHYTHWFQPMNGITAEKHECFIQPSDDGKVILSFSGKELIKGESDASSFPSGGLRATFEARGYTAWDPTSYVFVKNGILFIPTAFCSYTGYALDMKTPLLRSMEALNQQTLRILKIFGHDEIKYVKPTLGAEQEYFLVDEENYKKRKDLMYTGRTLFGLCACKGQEMEDHYFGSIQPKVQSFMQELNEELWRLGIIAKTEHKEVAPSQYELAPIYTTTNIACDHNHLIMELIQRIAGKHGMVALLHEKPFEGINGSGKHNNFSLLTDTQINLLEPGQTPFENAQFLLFLCAIIKAVDEYQDLLRSSVASAGNDHRLGNHEAPPAIISIFLGSELSDILEAIEKDQSYLGKEIEFMKIGVDILPKIPKDTTDRNRTSPLAFTGNKFEFRMPGSSSSLGRCNIVLNTIIAKELKQFATFLEQANDLPSAIHTLVKQTITKHKRIIFNGNGYDESWIEEASKRGLSNNCSTPESLICFKSEKTIQLFEELEIYHKDEILSRYEIMMEEYTKTLHIEAKTMIDIVIKEILPVMSNYSTKLANNYLTKKNFSKKINLTYENEIFIQINTFLQATYQTSNELENLINQLQTIENYENKAFFAKEKILSKMEELRKNVDQLEKISSKESWPMPTYGKLLFRIS